jgi:putative N6-adenine-specific DNA methylase
MNKDRLDMVATCSLGLEEFLEAELRALGMIGVERQKAAVTFRGGWADCWRANWRLRTANRVLVELARFNGKDGDQLEAGARNLVRRRSRTWDGIDAGVLFNPRRTFAIHATSSHSQVRDTRWVGMKVKDGLVDGQRDRFGERASVERKSPDLYLRVWLYKDQATLLLDTSGEPLDRRGYRLQSTTAPVRENLAAACVLASEWDGRGPVVDPMCGSGTLLTEAAFYALGWAPGRLREAWAFARLPGFDAQAFEAIRREPIPAPGPDVKLYGIDRDREAIGAARTNLERAGLEDIARVRLADAFEVEPPPGPGLLVVNPAYGERLQEDVDQWKRLGDLLKQRYTGWRAAILAGGESRGKHIGLKPRRRIPVRNGPLDARILLFDLY